MARYQHTRRALVEYREALIARLHASVACASEEVRDIDIGMLKALAAAIERIDDGTYGRCTCCGDRIERSRLDAVPTTLMCLDCALGEDVDTPRRVAS